MLTSNIRRWMHHFSFSILGTHVSISHGAPETRNCCVERDAEKEKEEKSDMRYYSSPLLPSRKPTPVQHGSLAIDAGLKSLSPK